ncbi:hypothetical protein SASPL_147722 [Salvia splendens]|uniref:F-box associated beta-propeller type 1 domain-containing protein n=1 Tax=Salvia splendens TaxID=180675 RepID=A0A8X8WE50_SALSN|nr:hypothetical protein SASPL_147722 [Salvia splendens]
MLPLSPYCSSQSHRDIYSNYIAGLGFDEYYKVLELLPCCSLERSLHANLYSESTDSWRELDLLLDVVIENPIKSVCKNGSFTHGQAGRRTCSNKMILCFDMKNEVFRTITISGSNILGPFCDFVAILAKDDCSFVIPVLSHGILKVYE